MHMRRNAKALLVLVLLFSVVVAACKGKNKPPVARPMPPPSATNNPNTGGPPPAPPVPVNEPIPVPPMPSEDTVMSKSIDDLNRDSPLRPLFFELDSSEVSGPGQQVLQTNASVLKKYPGMQVTVEGHCDERGTAEYNLALGDRRANAVRDYLISRGITADRLRSVSYGEERPKYDNAREETRRLNRRAALVVNLR